MQGLMGTQPLTVGTIFDRLRTVLAAAGLCGALAGGGGYLLAFFGELPVGACQTVVAAGCVLLALLVRAALRV